MLLSCYSIMQYFLLYCWQVQCEWWTLCCQYGSPPFLVKLKHIYDALLWHSPLNVNYLGCIASISRLLSKSIVLFYFYKRNRLTEVNLVWRWAGHSIGFLLSHTLSGIAPVADAGRHVPNPYLLSLLSSIDSGNAWNYFLCSR